MSSHASSPNRLAGFMFLASGVALAFLLIEWLVVARLGLQLGQGEVTRTLLALLPAALGAGAGGAVAALLLARWLAPVVTAIAAPVAALLLLDLYFAFGSGPAPLAKLLGAAGFALAVFFVLAWLIRRGPGRLQQALAWWVLAAALASLSLLLTVLQAVDTTGTVLAAGASVAAIILLLQGWRTGRVAWPVLAVVMLFAASAVLAVRIPVWQPVNRFATGKPSVLLVTIDTLRADHVGAYGYAGARTPNFDALAAQGVRFSQAVTANVYTGPSHASILSGLLPPGHGVLVNHMRLPAAVPTLADILRQEGYVTAAFTSGYTTVDKACGLPSRFLAWDDDIRPFRWFPELADRLGVIDLATRLYREFGHYNGNFGQGYRMGEDTADAAVAWLEQNGDRPFFMWTHFYDPHLPYRPPQQYHREQGTDVTGLWYALDAQERFEITQSADKVAAMIGLYDAEIAYVDAQLGRVLEAARRAAPDEDLLVVVTSDHGESMGEHGIYWFRRLYDPTLLVPLVIVPPESMSASPAVVETQVRLIDLAPTLLDMLGVDPGTAFDGQSLLPLMQGTASDSPGPAFSSSYSTSSEFSRERHSIRDQGWKLIRYGPGWDGDGPATLEQRQQELYDLGADAGELDNRIDSGTAIQDELSSRLDEMAGQGVAPELELTPEERERLRSLGYIQ